MKNPEDLNPEERKKLNDACFTILELPRELREILQNWQSDNFCYVCARHLETPKEETNKCLECE